MSDLIDRQAAIDALGDEPEVWSEKDEYEQGLNNQWHYDVNALKAVPSAERHGHWIENETSYADPPTKQTCNCSICGKASTRPLGDWCRWCGAKMDEVEE